MSSTATSFLKSLAVPDDRSNHCPIRHPALPPVDTVALIAMTPGVVSTELVREEGLRIDDATV